MTLLEKKHADIITDCDFFLQKKLKTNHVYDMLSAKYYLSSDRIEKIYAKSKKNTPQPPKGEQTHKGLEKPN